MKVLQINSVCGIGSTGRIATDIHNILIEQGHESYVAYGRDLPNNCDNTIKIGTNFDNYTHVGKTRIFDKHGFGSKKATIEFIEKVKKLNPDIIHLHNIHGYYINIEILFQYLKESNKPVVWTLHDCWSFTGHCSHFDYIGCEKWKTGCFNCPQKKEYPQSLFLDSSKQNYKKKYELLTSLSNLTIVTPSRWLAKITGNSFLKSYPIRVINNGIDLDLFKPRKSNFKEEQKLINKFMVLGVSNIWSDKKGINYFNDLVELLDSSFKIVLVGVSNDDKVKVNRKILCLEKINNIEELAQIYTAADVFVNPTLEDTFPTTNLEALACGTPVITFETGGSIESIDNECGLVIEKGNLVELSKAIKSLKSNNFDNLKCINRSTQYNKYKRFDEYIHLYSEVLT